MSVSQLNIFVPIRLPPDVPAGHAKRPSGQFKSRPPTQTDKWPSSQVRNPRTTGFNRPSGQLRIGDGYWRQTAKWPSGIDNLAETTKWPIRIRPPPAPKGQVAN